MNRTSLVVFVFICFILDYVNAAANANVKFEVVLENMTECPNPQPPFAKKRIILTKCQIKYNKGRTFASGSNTVLSEVPFQNFSASTYRIDASGRQELMVQARNLNCHSFVSRLFLVYANFRYVKNNCRVLKGTYTYREFDMDKVMHGIPNWHAEGRMLHRIELVFNGNTILCVDTIASVKNLD